MKKDNKINWYVASLLEVFEYYKKDKTFRDKTIVNENYYIIKANSFSKALQKSFILGLSTDSVECVDKNGEKGLLKFYGVSNLTPIYGNIEDGTELLWFQYNNMSKNELIKRIKYKPKKVRRVESVEERGHTLAIDNEDVRH